MLQGQVVLGKVSFSTKTGRSLPEVLEDILEFLLASVGPPSLQEIAAASGLEESQARQMILLLADRLGFVSLEREVVFLAPDIRALLESDLDLA